MLVFLRHLSSWSDNVHSKVISIVNLFEFYFWGIVVSAQLSSQIPPRLFRCAHYIAVVLCRTSIRIPSLVSLSRVQCSLRDYNCATAYYWFDTQRICLLGAFLDYLNLFLKVFSESFFFTTDCLMTQRHVVKKTFKKQVKTVRLASGYCRARTI